MKKILFLLAIALPLVFASCSKDDEPTKPSVTNTQWVRVESGITATIDFINDKECTWELKTSTGSIYSSELYTYKYEDPIVTMTPQKDGLAVLKGTISGSGMKLYNVSQDKEIGIYTKKQ